MRRLSLYLGTVLVALLVAAAPVAARPGDVLTVAQAKATITRGAPLVTIRRCRRVGSVRVRCLTHFVFVWETITTFNEETGAEEGTERIPRFGWAWFMASPGGIVMDESELLQLPS